MSEYMKSLKRVFDNLPEIAKSEGIKGNCRAKTEILRAYIHLVKALNYLKRSKIH